MKKFERIYQDLEAKIKSGIYPTSTLLPSENELTKIYDVSRGTIRKSLDMLEKHGYINKQQGKGNIVLNHAAYTFPISGIKSYKEIAQEYQFSVETKVILNKRIKVPAFILEVIDIDPDEEFIHLIRVRYIHDKVEIIDHDLIRASVIPEIPDDVANNSIYEYFEDDLGLTISYAHKEFFAEKATELDQDYFEINADDFVITVNSFVYLNDTTFFQFTASRHRLETFKFQEIARR